MVIFFLLFLVLKSEEINPCLKKDSTDPDKCVSCLKGYGLSDNGVCEICPRGTYSYGGKMKCTSCSEYANCKNDPIKTTCKFYARYEGMAQCSFCDIKGYVNHRFTGCYACSEDCEECENGPNAGKCKRCKPGYGLDERGLECTLCEEGFGSDGFSECKPVTSETDGFLVFDSTENAYKPNNDKFCETFNEDGTCATCLNGVDPTSGSCTNVFDINTNSEMLSNGRCTKLGSGSATSNVINCVSCQKPYVLENGVCVSCLNYQHYKEKQDENGNNVGECVLNIFACVHQIGDTCYGCDEGYLLVDNACKLITDDCEIIGGKNCEKCDNDVLSFEDGKCDNLISNCDYSKDDECLMCSNGYYQNSDSSGGCEKHQLCGLTSGDYCYKTSSGKSQFFANGLSCNKDQLVCITPTSQDNEEGTLTQIDYQCKTGDYLTKDSKTCINENSCASAEDSRCVKCNNGYYLYQGGCVSLTQIIPGCIKAVYNYTNENLPQYENSDERKVYCIECESGKQLYNGYCYDASKLKDTLKCSNDLQINPDELISCNCASGKVLQIDGCYDLLKNCETATSGEYCRECIDNYFGSEGICYECENGQLIEGICYQVKETQQQSLKGNDNDNCYLYSSKGCLKCNSGYYLNDEGKCEKCGENCLKCDSEQCYECLKGLVLDKGVCMEYDDEGCETPFPNGDGCAICKTTHFRTGQICEECDESCLTCLSADECTECSTDYFKDSLSSNETKLCLHYDVLTNCITKTQAGCEECEDGYYLDSTRCKECHLNCSVCSSETVCSACSEGFVFKNSNKESCMKVEDLKHCKSAKDGLCESCEGDYVLSSDKLSCNDPPPNYGMLIGLPVGIGGAVLIIIIILLIILLFVLKHKKDERKRLINVAIFDMDKSNVKMDKLQNVIVSNKKAIDFNEEVEEIDVIEQSRELICIGNSSNRRIEVQFTLKEGCEKYEMETNPQKVGLKKGQACEFEIFLKPMCTCEIDEQIILTVLYVDDSSEEHIPIRLHAKTKLTTRLDYEELKQEKKLGEGSFGIVFLGEFRGYKVAIKKMKTMGDESDQNKLLDEFEKEVDMLNKFRNDYIVHFFGAVFIPNKICMVTEFAQHGSLQDLMDKRKNSPISEKIRMKIILDCSRGIKYLHDNGVLHRDIKPDNFLVISLEKNLKVNAKLTDFGASRNLNLMMTNMTFTKGIGSPKYMAPEILQRKHYKRPSDIYSFAITMLEVMTWQDAFPKTIYQFPWSIADAVSEGRRPESIEYVENEEMKLVIQGAWKQEPSERLQIDDIIQKIESLI